jgi:hypothetical protein
MAVDLGTRRRVLLVRQGSTAPALPLVLHSPTPVLCLHLETGTGDIQVNPHSFSPQLADDLWEKIQVARGFESGLELSAHEVYVLDRMIHLLNDRRSY